MATHAAENQAYVLEEKDPNDNVRQRRPMTEESAVVNNTAQTGKDDLIYAIDDVPPWYICILCGFQHYLTSFGAIMSVPLILAPGFCVGDDSEGQLIKAELIGTAFFVSGIATLLQTTFGARLPIVQGGSFSFLVPTFAILSLPKWKCPSVGVLSHLNTTNTNLLNATTVQPNIDTRELFKERMLEVQGAIAVSAVFQVIFSFSGILGLALNFIGPLTIAPSIILVGLSLTAAASNFAAKMWWLAIMTIAFIALFSQYLRNVDVPFPYYSRATGCGSVRIPIFKLFPIIIAICLSWLICYILTVTGALPTDKGAWGYGARTDTRIQVLQRAPWFRFPYPGQWGLPSVSVAGVFGMLAGIIAGMIESVGDYYSAARLSAAPPPPVHAVNRGLGVEGVACILAGMIGSGNGTTSYSENIGALGITKVGSRRVIQAGACLMIVLAVLNKFGALFVTIPDPVLGGLLLCMFGMISAVGISTLQFVDLNSTRNLFILGLSVFFGLSFPAWMNQNSDAIKTGVAEIDQIFSVLFSTSMFVGGAVAFLLDNTVPGSDEERGIKKWRQQMITQSSNATPGRATLSCYNLPFFSDAINSWKWTRFIPFCPNYDVTCACLRCKGGDDDTLSEPERKNGVCNKEEGPVQLDVTAV